jgi:Protein of unknown function (DUF1573)
MKKLFSKTWFQIILFGSLIAVLLVVVDDKMGWFKKGKSESDTYNGPVRVDKSKTYFTEVNFNETEFDFGKVKEGDTLSHVFKMKNTGKEPLFVFKSVGSCDCIGAVVTKEMIQPDTEVEVKVFFNTKGRKGVQNRNITLTCNTEPADYMLSIKAEVE